MLARYANAEQRRRWLLPLLEGRIRSCFAMTEPTVASSDATNIGISIARDEARGEYVINGSKWWCTGAGSLHCKIMILMGKTRTDGPIHKQQSQLLVPMDTPGITLLRPMLVRRVRVRDRMLASIPNPNPNLNPNPRPSARMTLPRAIWRSSSRTFACRSRTSCWGRYP